MNSKTRRAGSSAIEFLRLRWKPSRDLLAVAVSWILVVGTLYTATFLIGEKVLGGMGYFLTYAILGALVFGFGLPVAWTFYIRKRSIAALGLTAKHLVLSIIIQVVAAGVQLGLAARTIRLPELPTLIPLIALSLAIGLFEAVFWRGWVQLRIEDAFGVIPGMLLGAGLYALYHIGYGMRWSEMLFLFGIGLMFAVVFRITRSVFILWPVFQPFGQLMTLIRDGLQLPWAASLGFLDVLGAMIAVAIIFGRMGRKKAYEP